MAVWFVIGLVVYTVVMVAVCHRVNLSEHSEKMQRSVSPGAEDVGRAMYEAQWKYDTNWGRWKDKR